jgi:heterodisulfide reductase subunit C
MKKAIQFGYSVNNDRQIDFDSKDKEILLRIVASEPSINLCISCGTCAATCTAAQFTDFSLRRTILLVRRCQTEDLAAETAKCMLCGKCQLACPRGVNTRNLILQIRRALQIQYPKPVTVE